MAVRTTGTESALKGWRFPKSFVSIFPKTLRRKIKFCDGSGIKKKRVRGIEPPCAAWEAAVLPLNYTREEIFDFRFAIADCNPKKFAFQIAEACAALGRFFRDRM